MIGGETEASDNEAELVMVIPKIQVIFGGVKWLMYIWIGSMRL